MGFPSAKNGAAAAAQRTFALPKKLDNNNPRTTLSPETAHISTLLHYIHTKYGVHTYGVHTRAGKGRRTQHEQNARAGSNKKLRDTTTSGGTALLRNKHPRPPRSTNGPKNKASHTNKKNEAVGAGLALPGPTELLPPRSTRRWHLNQATEWTGDKLERQNTCNHSTSACLSGGQVCAPNKNAHTPKKENEHNHETPVAYLSLTGTTLRSTPRRLPPRTPPNQSRIYGPSQPLTVPLRVAPRSTRPPPGAAGCSAAGPSGGHLAKLLGTPGRGK